MATKDDKLVDGYLDAVCDHLKEAGELAPGYKVDTIYFGGGTPTFFGADGMAVILSTIRRNFDVVADAEITFEANPDSVSDRLLHRLRAEGYHLFWRRHPHLLRCRRHGGDFKHHPPEL